MEVKLAALRDFTGSTVPDAKLRSYLVRAAGDVDSAAGLVLSEGALTVAAAQFAKPISHLPAPSALPVASTQSVTVPSRTGPHRDDVRRAAWNSFYKSHYKSTVQALGLAPKPPAPSSSVSLDRAGRSRVINHITDLWRDLGPEKRNELYAKVRDELLGEKQGVSVGRSKSVNPTEDGGGNAALMALTPAKGNEGMPSGVAVEGTASDASLCTPGFQTTPRRRRSTDDAVTPPAKVARLTAEFAARPAAHMAAGDGGFLGVPSESQKTCDHAAPETILQRAGPHKRCVTDDDEHVRNFADGSHDPPCEEERSGTQTTSDVASGSARFCDEAEKSGNDRAADKWPKQIASRIFECSMFVAGRNVIRAGDRVDLEPSQSIVRFCVNKREIGRLPADAAGVISPALLSGHVTATARVIEAPKTARILSPVYLEVNLFLQKSIFDAKQGSRLHQDAGLKSKEEVDKAPRQRKKRLFGKSNRDKCDENEGIDVGRLAVVNMLSALNFCEPVIVNSAVDVEREASVAEVSRTGSELYYNAVEKIEGDISEYSQPTQLRCELRNYQKHGVCWMRAREEYGNSREGTTDAMLHPLWKRKRCMDGSEFYINAATGGLSLLPPLASSEGPFGGILADEMGLGKTVECIALMVWDRDELDRKLGKLFDKSFEDQKQDVEIVSEGHVHEASQASGPHRDEDTNGPLSRQCSDFLRKPKRPGPKKATTSSNTQSGKATETVDAQEVKGQIFTRSRSTRARVDVVVVENGSTGEDDASKILSEDGDDHDKDWSDFVNDDDSDFEPAVVGVRKTGSRSRGRHSSLLEVDDIAGWARRPLMNKPASKETRLSSLRRKERTGKSDSPQGGTLLVVPMSMIGQWVSELRKHVQPGFFRVSTHHEQRCTARELSVAEADVIVTTYGVLASEAGKEDASEEDHVQGRGPLFEVEWRRIILDEAHSIKGRITKNAKACFRLRAQRRWCVTGSPIQNHINDVQPLLRFIGVSPWGTWGFWQRGILSKMESSDARLKAEALSTLRDILSPLTLRRLKSTLDSDGKPLVLLVARNEEIVKLQPGPAEKDFYETLHKKSRAKFDTFLAQGKVMHEWGSVLELLLRLRQACCHPWLVFAASQADATLMKDRQKMYECFALNGSKAYAEKVLSQSTREASPCPICLCVIEDATAVRKCGHSACRACLLRMLSATGSSAVCPICRVAICGKSDIVTLPRHGGSRFPMDIRANWQSSAKLDAILSDVKMMQDARDASQSGSVGKTVVMSQFTSFLDIVGTMFDKEGVRYLRFDGTLPVKKRVEVLKAFADDCERISTTANVMLVSLRSGSVGLNLCSASLLLLMDPSWNPAQDAQAAARVHRHGQTRAVTIKRYVIENSVEERLLQVQDRKLDMTEGALSTSTEDDKINRVERLKLLFSRNDL